MHIMIHVNDLLIYFSE